MSAFSFNGFLAGHIAAGFTRFRVSPVKIIRAGTDAEAVKVCSPADRAFWSIYGYNSSGWRLVHDAEANDAGKALFILSQNPAARFDYTDLDVVTPTGTLAELADLLTDCIHNQIASHDDRVDFYSDDFEAHPMTNLRQQILTAIESQTAE